MRVYPLKIIQSAVHNRCRKPRESNCIVLIQRVNKSKAAKRGLQDFDRVSDSTEKYVKFQCPLKSKDKKVILP